MKSIFFFLSVISFFFFNLSHSFSQSQTLNKGGVITGKILDSISHLPIEYATISLFRESNPVPINGIIADHSGNFTLKVPEVGSYKIMIDFVGYISKKLGSLVISGENGRIRLGLIYLLPKTKQLKGLVVTAQKDFIENRIDKLVYNAEKDLTAQGGVATDILKKIPQIAVDVDGNVELSGSSSIRFLINGKPSAAFGSNVTDVLQSIPSSQIKSIEVITNPSAKYDGQGIGGIINIILKQNKAQGINGNISLTAGSRNENGSFNTNLRKGNFGLSAFISGNARLEATTQNSNIQVKIIDSGKNTTTLNQYGPSKIWRNGIQTGIGMDWNLSKYWSWTAGVNYDLFRRSNSAAYNQANFFSSFLGYPNPISTANSFNNSLNINSFHVLDFNVDLKKKFDKKDEELEFLINSSFGMGNLYSSNELYALPFKTPKYPYRGDSTKNPIQDQETEISIDYTTPLKKSMTLGLGAKVSLRNLVNTVYADKYDTLAKRYVPDSLLSNQVHYKQQVYAVYSELNFPISQTIDFKLGLRYQRTALNTEFSNAIGKPSPPGYNSFLPSVFISKKLKNEQLIKLSYSRRIEPPKYSDLNPYINTSDPNNFTQGNLYLLPEVADRLEFSYTSSFKLGSFALTLFYRTSNHDIQPYIVIFPKFQVGNTVYINQTVSTIQNVGLEEDAGLNLYTNLHISQKLDFRTNATLFHRYTINALDPGLNAESFNYRISTNFTYSFTKEFIGEFSGNFNSSRNQVQGHYPSFTTYSLGLRKPIFHGKGSIALVATNFLNENVEQPTTTSGLNFNSVSNRSIPYRSFGLNFTWKFGGMKFKKEKDDKTGGLENSPDGN